MTGCCASQSISRSGCRRRSSSAIATSRRAWPSPIGEEMNSARLPRAAARAPTRRRRLARQTKSRSSRLTFTGSRAVGQVPGALEGDQLAAGGLRPARPPAACGRTTVAVAVDHERRAAHPLARFGAGVSLARHAEPARGVGERLRRRLERPADAVLDLLGRVRLVEALGEEELEEAAVVA